MGEMIWFLAVSGLVFLTIGVGFLVRPPRRQETLMELAGAAIKREVASPFELKPFAPFAGEKEDPYEDIFDEPIPAYKGTWSPAFARKHSVGPILNH